MILYFLYHTTLTRSHVYLIDYLSKRHDGKVFFFFLCHFIIFSHLTWALQADYLLFITKLIIPHLSWRTRCLLRSNLSVIIWRWGECTDQEGFWIAGSAPCNGLDCTTKSSINFGWVFKSQGVWWLQINPAIPHPWQTQNPPEDPLHL